MQASQLLRSGASWWIFEGFFIKGPKETLSMSLIGISIYLKEKEGQLNSQRLFKLHVPIKVLYFCDSSFTDHANAVHQADSKIVTIKQA